LRNYRFTINNDDVLAPEHGLITIKNTELLHQIKNVLRLREDSKEEISFIDGMGKVYEVTVFDLSQKSIAKFKILNGYDSKRELSKQLTFLVPVIKADAFSLMLRKLTELGVQTMIPVAFERSQEQNIKALEKTLEKNRLDKIIQEAVEQCEGAVFPRLTKIMNLADAMNSLDSNSGRIFASERMADQEENQNFSVQSEMKSINSLVLAVGPEGGLTEDEVELLLGLGFRQYSLGSRLLKAETAAIVLASQLIL
jgi:16S rRNA (uracil1498-N3)-methyltransferase